MQTKALSSVSSGSEIRPNYSRSVFTHCAFLPLQVILIFDVLSREVNKSMKWQVKGSDTHRQSNSRRDGRTHPGQETLSLPIYRQGAAVKHLLFQLSLEKEESWRKRWPLHWINCVQSVTRSWKKIAHIVTSWWKKNNWVWKGRSTVQWHYPKWNTKRGGCRGKKKKKKSRCTRHWCTYLVNSGQIICHITQGYFHFGVTATGAHRDRGRWPFHHKVAGLSWPTTRPGALCGTETGWLCGACPFDN